MQDLQTLLKGIQRYNQDHDGIQAIVEMCKVKEEEQVKKFKKEEHSQSVQIVE